LIETGLFIFNTEAHPVDGGSLECCRSQHSAGEANEANEIDMKIYDFLNIESLVDRYVRLSNQGAPLPLSRPFATGKPTLQEEYKKLQEKIKEEFKLDELKFKLFCESIFNNGSSASLNSKLDFIEEQPTSGHDFPFTCSLNNTFKVTAAYLNNLNNFP
jgi:hypothetical protein